MKAYKGFKKDMTCREFQYEEGKTYETDEAKLCEEGFHACENPLDCFDYYAPGESVYHEVEIEDNGERSNEDTKVVGKKIKIGARLDALGICEAHFQFVKEHCNPVEGRVGGNREAVSAGESGSASAGKFGSASAGESGSASAGKFGSASAGCRGSASAGDYGSASAGESGSASAGYRGCASAGNYGSASAGKFGVAASRGSAAAGEDGVAVARGNGCTVKGGLGAVLVLAEQNDDNKIREYKVAVVDGETIKADTWYKLVNGEFIETS